MLRRSNNVITSSTLRSPNMRNTPQEPARRQNSEIARRMILQHLNLREPIPPKMKHHIAQLLSHYPKGIRLPDLKFLYYGMHGIQLNHAEHGYSSIEAFVRTLENDNILMILRSSDGTSTILPAEHELRSKLASTTPKYKPEPVEAETSSPINDRVLNNMRKLNDHFPNGIPITELCERYLQVSGNTLDLCGLGYNNAQEIINHLEEIFRITILEDGEWLLTDARLPLNPEPTAPVEIPVEVQQNLYDLLKLEKEGVLLSDLDRTYRANFSKPIPWKTLHYRSLEVFIHTLKFALPIELVPSGFEDYRVSLAVKKPPVRTVQPDARSDIPADVVMLGETYLPLKLGGEKDKEFFGVILSQIDSPGKMWLQLVTDENGIFNKELENLMNELERFYTSSRADSYVIPDDLLKESMLCAVLFLHGEDWHRGCILEKMGPTTYKVFYIDYGSVGIIEKARIRFLKKSFNRLPAQAFMARLSNVKPNGDQYSEESKQLLLLLTKQKSIMAKLTSRTYHNMISVFLCDTTGEEDVLINHLLVKEDYVWPCDDDDRPPRPPLHAEPSSQYLDFASYDPTVACLEHQHCSFYDSTSFTSMENNLAATSHTVEEYNPTTSAQLYNPHQSRPISEKLIPPPLDPEVVRRVQAKALAKKRCQIPRATVEPMQYSRAQNAEPGTLELPKQSNKSNKLFDMKL